MNESTLEEYNPEDGDSSSNVTAFINKALLSTLDQGTYFELDPHTISSLDYLPKLRPDYSLDSSSCASGSSRSDTNVHAVLHKCRTPNGIRLLGVWMKHPLKCKSKIDLRLDIVEHFMKNTELRVLCHETYLRKIPDLLRIAFRMSKEKCSIMDLMRVYQACKSVQDLCNSFDQIMVYVDVTVPEAITKLFTWAKSSCQELKEFMDLLEDSIDMDSIDELGEYLVKPSSDENIAKLSLEISSLCTRARDQLAGAAHEIGLEADKTIKLETDPEKGFCFKVTRNNEQLVRGNHGYEQINMVKKDGYRFTNKALTKLSNKYVNAKEEYNSLAKYVIEEIISKVVMYDNEVLEFSMTITLIDVFVALSVAAVQNNYVKPLILDSEAGRIYMEKLRHPCMENQPDIENYVPNDVVMSKDDKKFYLITGPNMGGKSTFIKAVAINVLMAHCGSMIPVEEARISVIDGVYTRVGAGDRQSDGISTFMGEMMDISTILKKATENSLVIIDELGRGTSTFDGFGLAWSISKHLASEIKCYTLFATHFHELTELEEEVDTVGNLHVKAVCQADKLTMLFNVGKGVCDESYGINVAQYTQFPEHVIEMAKNKLKSFEEVPGFDSKKDVRNFVRDCIKKSKTLKN